ncbi:MAG: MCE family protein, partial [Alphaproteobacteria bacterium]|nr:MCE family protein [Alphaproteobacteria bacterium]
PLRDFTGEGLYELTNFMVEARALIDSLERVTTQVERDPARFLFGNQQQGYETPN